MSTCYAWKEGRVNGWMMELCLWKFDSMFSLTWSATSAGDEGVVEFFVRGLEYS